MVKQTKIYITKTLTFEKICKGCSELVKVEDFTEVKRVSCRADKCVKPYVKQKQLVL